MVWELLELTRKTQERNPVQVTLNFGSSSQRLEVSQSGNPIVQVIEQTVGTVLAPSTRGQDPKEEKKRRDEIAKSGKHMKAVIELGTTIQKVVSRPSAAAPRMTQLFRTSTAAGLVRAAVPITLAAAYRLKLNAKS